MLPRRTLRIRITLPVALLVGVLSCAVNVWAQGVSPRPYSKEAIVGLLKGAVSPKRIAVLARQRGIDFQITPKVESELRRAGATAELLATLREVAPKPPAAQIETPRRVVSAPAAGTVRENERRVEVRLDSRRDFHDGLLAGGQRVRRLRKASAPSDDYQRFLDRPDARHGGRLQALCGGYGTADA